MLAFEFEIDAAVLGKSSFGDVEVRHDLEARDDGSLEEFDLRGNGGFVQDAIGAVADAQVVFERFDVDVGGALVDGGADDLVDEIDDGGLGVFLIELVGFLGELVVELFARATFEDFLECFRTDAVALAQAVEDEFAGGHGPVMGFATERFGDELLAEHVEGVVGQEPDAVLVLPDGENVVAEGEANGELLPQFGRHFGFGLVPPRQAVVGGYSGEESFFVNAGLVENRGDEGTLLGNGVFDGFGTFRSSGVSAFLSALLQTLDELKHRMEP